MTESEKDISFAWNRGYDEGLRETTESVIILINANKSWGREEILTLLREKLNNLKPEVTRG